MKLTVILLACFISEVLLQSPVDFLAKMGQLKTDCIKETDVNPDLVEKLIQGNLSDDKNLKCFAKCVLVKVEALSTAGDVQLEKWQAKLPPSVDKSKVDVAVKKCKNVKASDSCDTALLLLSCLGDAFKASM